MNLFYVKARTALALGLINLARVFWFKIGVKLGINPVRKLVGEAVSGDFFLTPKIVAATRSCNGSWPDDTHYFGRFPVKWEGECPDWHLNPITGKRVKNTHLPWWQIPDFDAELGDIKAVWEASRFDWVLSFAQQAAMGSEQAHQQLNGWLNDWCRHNPPYCGPNWKCGQEASIRVMHLAMASLMLQQTNSATASLQQLVAQHLMRIEPTIGYAMAQDNNHGTSEAAALYIGGLWLTIFKHPKAAHWQQLGRKWLENRIARLVMEDGSFSQHSLTYHRVMLDTMSMVEVWRRQFDDIAFSGHFQQRLALSVDWLDAMAQAGGDAPNLGANDGADFLNLTGADYRDFRPSVELASNLFRGISVFPAVNDQLAWLGVVKGRVVKRELASACFNQGGYGILREGGSFVLLRFPRFRFRPSQADALHLDFWLDGKNLLRDAGTYGYNKAAKWLDYFSGTKGHNTVQFDDRDQMPRLSRFLFGSWLKTQYVQGPLEQEGKQTFEASYKDAEGAIHARSVALAAASLEVGDKVAGFTHKAVLRWRLQPGSWQWQGSTLVCNGHKLSVSADVPIARIELTEGWESRYYQEKTATPVLEVEVHQPGKLTTHYSWT